SGGLRQVLQPGLRDRRAGDVDEDLRARGAGGAARVHAGLTGQAVGLAAVARGAGGDDVVPAGGAALGAGDHVVDRQVRTRAAVLAGPAVAREDGPPRDLAAVGVAGHVDVG